MISIIFVISLFEPISNYNECGWLEHLIIQTLKSTIIILLVWFKLIVKLVSNQYQMPSLKEELTLQHGKICKLHTTVERIKDFFLTKSFLCKHIY